MKFPITDSTLKRFALKIISYDDKGIETVPLVLCNFIMFDCLYLTSFLYKKASIKIKLHPISGHHENSNLIRTFINNDDGSIYK